jgi:hypothetical protein
MNILNYLFAETVNTDAESSEAEQSSELPTGTADMLVEPGAFNQRIYDESLSQVQTQSVNDSLEQLNAVTNSVFHSVATNEQPKQNIVGSRDAAATDNDFVRSAVQYKVGSNTFDAQLAGCAVQTFH